MVDFENRYQSRDVRRLATPLTLVTLLAAIGCQNPLEPVSSSDQHPDLAVSQAGPTTYYLSPGGSDKNAGTSPTKPWRTLGKASGVAFSAGDRLLLQGGSIFLGRLSFDGQDRGTAASPIVVSSYGSGRAVIQSGNTDGIVIYNTAGLVIKNLIIQGAGRTANGGNGINAYTDRSNTTMDYLWIDSVEVTGFGRYGVAIGGGNATAGFKDVTVVRSSAYGNALGGFHTYSQAPYSNKNVYFGYLRAYNNPGTPGGLYPSGSGIEMGGVRIGTIERSIAFGNGALCDNPSGPVGIWAYDSDGIVIQFNESYGNRTGGASDGGGFDLDQNTRNSVVQYNYSHGNDGAGFLFAHAPNNLNHTGNVVRYNISENDGRRNSYSALMIWGRVQNAEIHNNTVYLTPSGSGSPRAVWVHNSSIPGNVVKSVHFRANILSTTGGLKAIDVTPGQVSGVDLRFEGNSYHGGSVAPKFTWGGSTFSGLTSWRSATGQERLNGTGLGIQGNPGLVNPGGGGTINDPTKLATLAAYQLRSTSPLINKGLNLLAMFNLAPGPMDFYGGAILSGPGHDIGAHEWRSSAGPLAP